LVSDCLSSSSKSIDKSGPRGGNGVAEKAISGVHFWPHVLANKHSWNATLSLVKGT